MKTKKFDHENLKQQFSQDLYLYEILKSTPLPPKESNKEKKIVVITKKEDEKSEKARKNWTYGEISYLITLQG